MGTTGRRNFIWQGVFWQIFADSKCLANDPRLHRDELVAKTRFPCRQTRETQIVFDFAPHPKRDITIDDILYQFIPRFHLAAALIFDFGNFEYSSPPGTI